MLIRYYYIYNNNKGLTLIHYFVRCNGQAIFYMKVENSLINLINKFISVTIKEIYYLMLIHNYLIY